MYELKEYLNSINHTKENVMDSDDEFYEKKYPAYIVNKCLSAFSDSIFYANEINGLHHVDNRLQYDFLLNSLRKRKRFTKWLKASKIKDIDVVKEYYGYSNEKAKQALEVLTKEQIKIIKTKLTRGGRHGRIGVDT